MKLKQVPQERCILLQKNGNKGPSLVNKKGRKFCLAKCRLGEVIVKALESQQIFWTLSCLTAQIYFTVRHGRKMESVRNIIKYSE